MLKYMKFTGLALKNLFSKPVTRNYPAVPRDYPARTRGHVENDLALCILCGMCAKKCPADAIRVDRPAGNWSIERFGCIQCGSCIENCPRKCLSMRQSYPEPGAEKRTDTYHKDPPPKPAPLSPEKIAELKAAKAAREAAAKAADEKGE